MTSETLAANTVAKAAASTGASAIVRAIQSGVSKKITIIAAVVAALSAASVREFCKALGLWYPLASSAVPVSITGTTAETALATIVVPAGALGPNGMMRVKAIYSYTNSANSKTLRARLGTTMVGGLLAQAAVTTTVASVLDFIVGNRNSQSSQIAGMGTGGFVASTTATSTPTVDTSVETNIYLIGALANAGETITLEAYFVDIKYVA